MNTDKQTRVSHGFFTSIGEYLNLTSIITRMIDLVFPPICLNCERVDYHLCDRCSGMLQQLPFEIITPTIETNIQVVATGNHDGLLQAGIQALKYHNQRHLGHIFAIRIYETISELNWTIDTIVPVPLHTTRLAKRGYNQAKEIAAPLADVCDIMLDTTSIVRHRNTVSQVTLSRQERKLNLEGAFAVKSNVFQGKSVLLVDDVTTTGATLNACAAVIKLAGARSVKGISVTAARFQN